MVIIVKVSARLLLISILSFTVLFIIFSIALALTVYAYNKNSYTIYPAAIFVWYFYCSLLGDLDIQAVSPPGGMILSREDVPKLFEMISEIAQNLSVPVPSSILLTVSPKHELRNFESSKTITFKKKTCISLSLPALLYCSVETFRAHLAYIFSTYHTPSGKVFRLAKETQNRVNNISVKLDLVTNKSFRRKIIWKFYRAYAHRIQSDLNNLSEIFTKIGINTCFNKLGSKSIQSLLIDDYILSNYMARNMWKPIKELARSNPTLPLDAFQYMYQKYKERSDDHTYREIFTLLNTVSKSQFIHTSALTKLHYLRNLEPSKPVSSTMLIDRLVSEGVPIDDAVLLGEYEIQNASEKCAAEILFGEMYLTVCRRFEKQWISNNGNWYRDEYVTSSIRKSQINTLIKLSEDRELSLAEKFNLAYCYSAIGNKSKAFEIYFDILQIFPDNSVALENAGRLAFIAQDTRAEDLLWKCIFLEPDLTPALGSLLIKHYNKTGNSVKAREVAVYIEKNKLMATNLSNARLFSPTNGYLNAFISPLMTDKELIEFIIKHIPEIISIYLYERVFDEYEGATYITIILIVKTNKQRTTNTIQQEFLRNAVVLPFRCVVFTRTQLSSYDKSKISPYFRIWTKE